MRSTAESIVERMTFNCGTEGDMTTMVGAPVARRAARSDACVACPAPMTRAGFGKDEPAGNRASSASHQAPIPATAGMSTTVKPARRAIADANADVCFIWPGLPSTKRQRDFGEFGEAIVRACFSTSARGRSEAG